MVLKSIEDIGQLLPEEELHAVDDESSDEEELPEARGVPPDEEIESLMDSTDLYLAECRQIPLLDAKEEKTLGTSIEDGRYLSQLEQELSTRYGFPLSETDLLLELLQRFSQSGRLFEALCQHLSGYSKKSL